MMIASMRPRPGRGSGQTKSVDPSEGRCEFGGHRHHKPSGSHNYQYCRDQFSLSQRLIKQWELYIHADFSIRIRSNPVKGGWSAITVPTGGIRCAVNRGAARFPRPSAYPVLPLTLRRQRLFQRTNRTSVFANAMRPAQLSASGSRMISTWPRNIGSHNMR